MKLGRLSERRFRRAAEVDEENATIAKRVFEVYATDNHFLMELRQIMRAETGKTFQKGYLHKLLKNQTLPELRESCGGRND